MNDWLSGPRSLVLRFLRVPPEPDPPAGSPGSLRRFRAGRNYFRLKRWSWGIRQAAVLVLVLASIAGLHEVVPDQISAGAANGGRPIDLRTAHLGLMILEGFGLVMAIAQIPFTYAMVVLDYELRWYMVTDRILRIRDGLTRVREMTVSFANIQNISVRQGPLQRLLGLHDLVVTTAGGGGDHAQPRRGNGAGESFHSGVLRGVDNAEEIRDLILARLRRLRDSGLGDPDEAGEPDGPESAILPPDTVATSDGSEALVAARALLAEVRAWRTGGAGPGGSA